MRRARTSRKRSLRDLARRLGYQSHTLLSEYERGLGLPSDEVVEGYERELGLPRGSLLELLHRARVETHGDSFPKRRARQHIAGRGARFRYGLPIVLALVALAAVAVTSIILLRDEGRPALIAVDGSDPKATGCDADAVTLDRVDVYGPPQYRVGVIELRSSAACGTNWGKFLQSDGLPTEPRLNIAITIRRPADAAANTFALDYAGQNIYGNQLGSRFQCVSAEIVVTRAGTPSPAVSTSCHRSE